jgi:hypothetical protein
MKKKNNKGRIDIDYCKQQTQSFPGETRMDGLLRHMKLCYEEEEIRGQPFPEAMIIVGYNKEIELTCASLMEINSWASLSEIKLYEILKEGSNNGDPEVLVFCPTVKYVEEYDKLSYLMKGFLSNFDHEMFLEVAKSGWTLTREQIFDDEEIWDKQ